MFFKVTGAVVAFLIVCVVFIFGFGSWGTIEAGHRGVVLHMGGVTGEIKGEGFYTKTPWLDSVVSVDVRTQKEQVETDAASKDLQSVRTVVALNLSVQTDKVATLYQTIGKDYMTLVVGPSMQESLKAIIAQYTAEELVSKREVVREAIAALIADKLHPIGIHTEGLNIVNFEFSHAFNAAIEAKVTAEQEALAAQNKLAQKEFEAQQAVAVAKGKAEAMQIEAKALASNPNIIALRTLEKWNGILPVVSGNATPFIDVGKLSKVENTQ